MKQVLSVWAVLVLAGLAGCQVDTENPGIAEVVQTQEPPMTSPPAVEALVEVPVKFDSQMPDILQVFFAKLLPVLGAQTQVVVNELIWAAEKYPDINGRFNGYSTEYAYQGLAPEDAEKKLAALMQFFKSQGFSLENTVTGELMAYYFYRQDMICELYEGYYESAPEDFHVGVACTSL